MKIYSLDVSTTNVGRAYIDKKNNVYKFKIFQATGNIKDRIKDLYKQVKEDLSTFDYETIVLTRAVHRTINQNIAMLEGMLLSITIDDNTDFVAYPDVSWYKLIGNVKDQRYPKKKKTMEFFAETMGIKLIDIEEKWSGGTLDKLFGVTENGKKIPDDISDAFAAGYLLDKKQESDNIQHYQNELQNEINKLSAKIKKVNIKIDNTKTKLNNLKVQLKLAEEEEKLTNTKTSQNKVNKRIEWLNNEDFKLIDLERLKKELIEKRQKLRDEKNGD